MAKKIAWTGQAKADVRAIDQRTAMRILHGLARFTQTEEGDVKRLQDIEPPEFRLRVGAYRIRSIPEPNSKVLRFLLEAVCVCIRPHWTWFTPHTRKKLEFEALHNPFLRFDVYATCLCISCRHP